MEQGVAFTGDGLDEGRFSAAVWAQNGDMFTGGNSQGEAVQNAALASLDGNIGEFKKRWGSGRQ